jgi:phosphoribosylformylglycinamidine synthase
MSSTSSTATPAYRALGLSDEEYARILDILGREPSPTELAMFSVEWSEHCGYPRSKKYLRLLPRAGRFSPLVGTDAGGIIVDGRTIVFKAESHNHPSQVEPHAGAATGVGGIVRDILSMGARPVALLDSLRFGSLREPMTAFYVKGVVGGIQHYGNCIGVPTVGGEVTFDEAYGGNCLVNVMCVGVVEEGQKLMTSEAPADLTVMFLGSSTGRDGIGGCSVLASKELSPDDQKRPTVQIGDPFAGKCLIEATLEALASGAVIAMKDMGAAGLTCTTSEMAAAGGVGMEVELAGVPRREEGMEPYELMMSESQERMLAAVVPGRESEVAKIYGRWGLRASVIGRTVKGHELVITHHGFEVARLPIDALTNPQPIDLPTQPVPPPQADLPAVTEPAGGWKGALLTLLASQNICSRAWIYQQYDYQVQTNTVLGPGQADAAVIRLPIEKNGKTRGLAACMDANPRLCAMDPFEGARQAVAEAARNVACTGAIPAGLTDCLNFGNPEKPERFWQFVRAIEGISEVCKALEIPVVSGNVSFYNENPRGAVRPTPTIGMVGVLDDVSTAIGMGFNVDGNAVLLLGEPLGTLAASEYAAEILGVENGSPALLDLSAEKALLGALAEAHQEGLLTSAHDLSEGGLLVALAESCMAGGRGATLDLAGLGFGTEARALAAGYFGEAPSRVVVSTTPQRRAALAAVAGKWGVPCAYLGTSGGDTLSIDGWSVPLDELRRAHQKLGEHLAQ